MGSYANQPPSGVMRSLTEVFIFLRKNKNQFFVDESKSDDKMRLIAFNEDQVMVSNKKDPPSWVNIIDEINYEFTRIKSRIASLKELQNKHLSRPDFAEERQKLPQQTKIKELTDEITTMFGHSRRLIRLMEDDADHSLDKVRQNVVSSLMLSLNNLMNDFRASQSNYLRHLDTNLDTFIVKSSQTSDLTGIPLGGEEFSIEQIQQVIENEHMTKERENEILRISKSIFEMNGLMKDIGTMIVDQGAILDRIDYNCEQSASKINSALKSVEKAQKYQKKNKKMHLILILAVFAIFLMFLIILTKL